MACHVSVPYMKKKCTHRWIGNKEKKAATINAENVYMHKSVVIMREC